MTTEVVFLLHSGKAVNTFAADFNMKTGYAFLLHPLENWGDSCTARRDTLLYSIYNRNTFPTVEMTAEVIFWVLNTEVGYYVHFSEKGN